MLEIPEREKIRRLIIEKFDASANGLFHKGIFGLPFSPVESELIIIPVPWDVTVSYRPGTSKAPAAILEASRQIDLYHENFPGTWQHGIYMTDFPEHIFDENRELRLLAESIMMQLESKAADLAYSENSDHYQKIQSGFENISGFIEKTAGPFLADGKIVGICGGDHSVPLALINHLAEKYENMSVLQVDAHADLRDSYQGFRYSHASIMRNVVQNQKVKKLVQIGIRDYCADEAEFIEKNKNRIHCFTDKYINECLFEGESWKAIVDKIISGLSEEVYISFDIDGLQPFLCPNTGTPVPGGFSFEQIKYLFYHIYKSGKKIVGFDLCEVNPPENSDWDANIGMRILYELSCLALATNCNK